VKTGDLLTIACQSHYKRNAKVEVNLRNIKLNGEVVLQNIFDRNDAKYGVIRGHDLDQGFIFAAEMQIKTSRLLLGDDKAYCQVMVQREGRSLDVQGHHDDDDDDDDDNDKHCARVSDVEMTQDFELGNF